MIRKLRWKFISITMVIVTVLLTAIFVTLYYSTQTSYRQRSMEALRSAMLEDFPDRMPPPPHRAEVPLLVVDVKADGGLTVVKNRLPNTADEEAKNLISLVDERGTRAGVLDEVHLRYIHENKGPNGIIRYAFADIYTEQSFLHGQIIHSLIIGSFAFAAFFLFSLLLSGWAVKPVERAWEQQRQFSADASHELKTPLTVILANAGMLVRSGEIPAGQNRQRIEHILAESERMKQLVESLLTLARSDSGNETVRSHPLDLSYVVNSSVMAFEPLVFDMGKHISCKADENIRINGDEKKLRQLADILLDNACKYSTAGGHIEVRLSADGGREVLLTVANDGKPLTSAEIRQLFQRFYRADPSRSDAPGYGLGLSIAESIVKEHGGVIRAESDAAGINRFVVTLPHT